jgi:hypothetical protein
LLSLLLSNLVLVNRCSRLHVSKVVLLFLSHILIAAEVAPETATFALF